MATMAILVDWRPRSVQSDGTATSLLGLPLGPSAVVEPLRRELAATDIHGLVLAPNGPCGPDYLRAMRDLVPTASVVEPPAFGEFLNTLEPADWLLFVDARLFPRGDLQRVLLLKGDRTGATATHLVHLQRSDEGTRERVLCDEHNRVRVIQRLYEGVTHFEAAGVSCSLISVAMAQRLQRSDLFRLPLMRTRLAACGVPSQDLSATSPVVDLLQPGDLLALSESITYATTRSSVPARFTERAAGIWIGARCRIHPSSRIYGPAILHDDVVVDAEAVVIGPAVLGPKARVERQGLVSHSLIGRGVRVRAGTAVVRRVFLDSTGSVAFSEESTARPRPAAPLSALPDMHDMTPLHNPGALGKRAFDFLLALLGLFVLSPLLLVVAALIKLTSPGPVFFSDEREGRGGRVFRCWKFRTMVHGAHALQRALYRENLVDGPQFKLSNDPRVTRLGHWLRTTNIDELPQLFNVLRGEMSLIGPRPSPFRENQICVPWRNARLAVRPGITGLWQLCRSDRSAGDFHQWIYLDMLYVRRWCLSLDLRIFLATLLTLGGRWSVPLNWMIPGRARRAGLPGRAFAAQALPAIRYREGGVAERARGVVASAQG